MAITVKHKFVSAIPDAGDPTIVQPSNWNDDHELTGTIPVANGGTGASTLTGYVIGNGTSAMTASTTIPNTAITGLGTISTQNANNVAITGGTMSGVAITGYIPSTEKGVANGVATLDSGGTVPLSQLPPLGDLNYQGAWNASTNTPTLTSSVGTKGYYYVVSVAGTTNLNGITDWQVGDWAVFNGSVWQKIDNTDSVLSVNGYTGVVVLTQTDISGTVPTSRTITAGTGLSGGGDLSANRTLAIANTGVTATTYGSASAVPVIAVNAQGQITSATTTTIAIANTQVSGLGTMSTQNANNVAITGGSLNGVAIGGTTAGDGTFDILTANVSRLGNSTATYYQATNGLVSTGTFTATPPSDGLVMDYATGFGRFSNFAGDGYQWYNAGVATTKLMELGATGALNVLGNVTANGVLLTGNSGTVTSVSGTAPVSVATGTTTPVISLATAYGDTQNPYASKTANYFLAAPNGSAGAPTFRAVVAADIPTLNQNTTGSSGSCTGNAATVTNGFYTTSSFYLGTTSIAVNRASASQSLTGISIDGNAETVTNGVYTTGSYADPTWITSLAGSKITGTIDGGTF